MKLKKIKKKKIYIYIYKFLCARFNKLVVLLINRTMLRPANRDN